MNFPIPVISGLFKQKQHDKDSAKDAAIYRSFLRKEAKIGGELFGPVPEGVRREFFCLDANTWIWHEEWDDKNGKHQVRTTRYDVRPTGILKAQNNQHYQMLSLEEARNLKDAVQVYAQRVSKEVYGQNF